MSVKIFSGRSTEYLAKKIVKKCYKDEASELNKCEVRVFNDGEMNVHFTETIREDNVFIIQSTLGSDNIIELFLMIDAAKRASAQKINVVIPYFGYARSDRKDKPRVPISSKLMADLLTTAGATRVITLDLHVDQIQGFFNIPVDHLSSEYIFIPYIKNHFMDMNLVVAATDVGGSKKVSHYSYALGVDLVLIHKERSSPGIISSMKLIGDVKGKDIVFVDDIIDTGGSICRAAELVMNQGANSVRAIVCHPVLSKKAYDNINSSYLKELVVTDTIPIIEGLSDKITVLSIDDMFAKAIDKISKGVSISSEIFGAM